jgi:hypothetical protein
MKVGEPEVKKPGSDALFHAANNHVNPSQKRITRTGND